MNRASVVLLCITTLCVFFMLRERPKLDIKKYEDRISSLQSIIDTLEGVNEDLKIEAAILVEKIHQYDTIIDGLSKEIELVKDETQKRLDSVDRYNRDQLQKFFSKRYKGSVD
jgi:hypothetical protein